MHGVTDMRGLKTNRGALAILGSALFMVLAHRTAIAAELKGEPLARDRYISAMVVIYYAPSPKIAPEAKAAELLNKDYKFFARRKELKPGNLDPSVHVAFVDLKAAGLEPPSMDMLKYFGRGISAEQVNQVQRSTKALALSFVYQQANVLAAIAEMSKLAADIADATGGMVWDEETRELFSVEAWRKTHIDQWSDGYPMATKHTTLHAYNNGDLVRAVTLGMRKFGMPDLVINDFSWSQAEAIGSAINGLQQLLVEGAPVSVAGTFDFDIRAVKHSVYRKHLLDSRIEQARGIGKMTLAATKPQDGDPDNRLIEITFDSYSGKSPQEQQNQFIAEAFGSRDSVMMTKHTNDVMVVSKLAKERFETYRMKFDKGMAPGERLLVKAPFKTKDGGNEWMWVEVIKWQGGDIKGLLRNDPDFIPGLRAGAMVQVKQAEIFDYLHYTADGKTEGNETGPLLERNAK
jgi:uncharacterized protein YegJ (DUF2314 family)